MNSREKILTELRKNKPDALPLPATGIVRAYIDKPVEQFTAVLQAIGGHVKIIQTWEEAESILEQQKSAERIVVNGVKEFTSFNIQDYVEANPGVIEKVHTVILRGQLGVAENAAVWISERAMVNRLLPFLCQHLVLLLSEKDIVPSMHDAYAAIDIDQDGYGVFIAGPSKTADIEQSLVLGAHGPLSLQVLLVKEAIA